MKKITWVLISGIVVCLLISLGVWLALKSNQIEKPLLQQTEEIMHPVEIDFLDELTQLFAAKKVYAAPGDPAYELLKKGDEYYNQNKFDEAIECYQELIEKYPDSEYTIHGYTGLIICWGYKGELERNDEYLENSIEVAKELIDKYPDTEEALHTYGVIGSTYSSLKNWTSSVYWFEQTKQKYMESDNRENIAHIIGCLGFSYYGNEEFEKALKEFQDLINEYSDTQWVKATEGLIYFNMAGICRELKEFDKAIEYSKLGLVKGFGIIDKGALCFGVAEIYHYNKQDIKEAELWYQKVINEYPGSEWVDDAEERLREL